jgi:glycosyltransferase involved in cell wall biosynthesis
MPRIALVQPAPGERISGGYLYNEQMAAHGAWELVSARPGELSAVVEALDHDLVLADSIWLADATLSPFQRRAARGGRTGLVLHSLPSMIEAAERGGPLRTQPTAFEVAGLEALGLVITPGPHYRDLLAGRAVAVVICPPGVADGWRAPPRPRRSGRTSLISVGAVTPRKGFLDVLDALDLRDRRDDLLWRVVGSLEAAPGYGRAFQERCAGDPRVALMGQRQPQEVQALVIASDVLVMPSYDENHPLVILEAIAASVPTVAYAAGAAATMLDRGEGLVGPIGDRAALARNISRLVEDEPARQEMARACWRRQAELPDWPTAGRTARAQLEALAGPAHSTG